MRNKWFGYLWPSLDTSATFSNCSPNFDIFSRIFTAYSLFIAISVQMFQIFAYSWACCSNKNRWQLSVDSDFGLCQFFVNFFVALSHSLSFAILLSLLIFISANCTHKCINTKTMRPLLPEMRGCMCVSRSHVLECLWGLIIEIWILPPLPRALPVSFVFCYSAHNERHFNRRY